MAPRHSSVLAGVLLLVVLVAGLWVGANAVSAPNEAAGGATNTAHYDADTSESVTLPVRFEPHAFKATCHNTKAPGRSWIIAFDGQSQFISQALTESGILDEVLLVRGTENTRWLPLLQRVEFYEYMAGVPAELRPPVVGNAIDTVSRLTGLAGSTVFSVSEIDEVIKSGTVQLISRGTLRGMPVLQLRVPSEASIYTDVWLHALYGARLDARRYEGNAVDMDWMCEDFDTSETLSGVSFGVEIPSTSVVESMKVVPLDSDSGRSILARNHAGNIMAVPQSNERAVVEWKHQRTGASAATQSWAVVDTLENGIVIQAPDGADLPFAGLPEWADAGSVRPSKNGWTSMNIRGVSAATWTTSGVRTMVLASEPASIVPLVEMIQGSVD